MASAIPVSHSEIEIELQSQFSPPNCHLLPALVIDPSSTASTSTFTAVDIRSSSDYEYDIFLNHRGPDTKKTFASHLYRRLRSYGLQVFLDFQELQEGEKLTSQIQGAIASASVHVAIFSPHYAESNWCLQELILMIESKAPIIPVFYNVQPADLRWTLGKHEGAYAQALQMLEKKKTYDSDTHEEKPRYDLNTIENWRNAISSVAEISGFVLDACNGDEGELVDKIVERVMELVKRRCLNAARYPTGLDEKVKDFENAFILQRIGIRQRNGKPHVVGIVGLGGVGKTTLAKELFSRKRSYYQRSFFLSEVRENAVKSSLPSLQRQLVEGFLGRSHHTDGLDQGMETLIRSLSSCKFLLILDDIDNEDQLDALLPVQLQDVLYPTDSLVLITSRDKNVLTRSGVKDSAIYNLTGLNTQDSRDLFCSHAFGQRSPFPGFESLVDKFVKVCNGLPLSLKVVGGLLNGNNDKLSWEDQLGKLQSILPSQIKERLQISYDSLDGEEKQIFLDIACFLAGENKDTAIRIWNGSGWRGSLGFENLQNKCLVDVDSENCILMHPHLQDLGRDVVQASGFPRFLWSPTENMNIDDLLKQYSSVIKEVRGIRMVPSVMGNDDFKYYASLRSDVPWFKKRIHELLGNKYLMKLCNRLYYTLSPRIHTRKLRVLHTEDGLLEHILRRMRLPNLIWLRWFKCPYTSLPSWIPKENLRVLHVEGMKLSTLWHDKSPAPLELRELKITARILRIPKSIGQLKLLEQIYLSCPERHYRNKRNFSLPDEFCHLASLKRLEIIGFSITSLPDAFGNLKNLEHIKLSYADYVRRLPDSFGNLIRLKYFELTGACQMESLQESFGNLKNLEHIDLSGALKLKHLPNSFHNLSRLKYLDLYDCSSLTISRGPVAKLRTLQFLNLFGCDSLELPVQLPRSLEELHIGGRNMEDMLPPLLSDLTNLKELKLESCNGLNRLPDSVGMLTQLAKLEINHCYDLVEVRRLPSTLITLKLSGCPDLREIGLCGLAKLQRLDITFCQKMEEMPGIETLLALEELRATKCAKLKRIRGLAQLTKLRFLSVSGCPEFRELAGIEQVRSLEILDASECPQLRWHEEVLEQLPERLKEGMFVI